MTKLFFLQTLQHFTQQCSVYGKTSQFYKALVSLDMSAINIFEHDAMSAHLPIISQPKQQNVCICIFIVSQALKFPYTIYQYQQNYFWISALKCFVASLGLPGSFFGLLVTSLIMVLLTRSLGSPRKLPGRPQEATKNFRAEILTLFSLLFWKINVLINSF